MNRNNRKNSWYTDDWVASQVALIWPGALSKLRLATTDWWTMISLETPTWFNKCACFHFEHIELFATKCINIFEKKKRIYWEMFSKTLFELMQKEIIFVRV